MISDMKNEKNDSVMDDNRIVLHFDYLPCLNYSVLSNGISACSKFVIENHDTADWHNVTVRIKGEAIKEKEWRIDTIRCNGTFQLQDVAIEPDTEVLVSSTESIKTSFTLSIEHGDVKLIEKECHITLLAYDQWTGSGIMPELIASFVVPNNPVLSHVLVNAGRFMEKLTGSSSLDEYQTLDRNRVRQQVAAVYESLRSEGIVYSAPPASFENFGQRIRLSDKVLSEKLGTCIDTSLLMASCLEKIGINPIIVFFNGHALVGAWLTPTVYPQMVGDDASFLLKEMADGNNNLVLVESTNITSSSPVTFEESAAAAEKKVRDENAFQYFVDIHRCRLGGILPMAQRIERDGAWVIDQNGVEHANATEQVNHYNHYDLRTDVSENTLTKQQIWERKLLDFSLRNNLINLRLGKRTIPFMSFEIEHIEDHLQNGEDFRIVPCPDTKIQPDTSGMYDSVHQASKHKDLVLEFIRDGKIVTYLTDSELHNALKHVYRTARTAMEENGANSLFLSLGMLKWYETQKSEQPRFAPILLMPVDIVRKTGDNYIIRKRDEDIFLNITLVEFLKQNYNIDLSQMQHDLPKDESGVDVRCVLTCIRRAILENKKWDVLEESHLGIFSFNKFVMWNDIHTNAERLKENMVVSSLMEKRNNLNDTEERIDARRIDVEKKPMDFVIPLDVDSSQFEAVVESGRGKSFILQGPPGTGKSQTITNMIANALFQGKRVLFVAEKMAALSVVQARLDKIGIGPFCLELHSNKATKKHFLEQMNAVLNVKRIATPEAFATESDKLYEERKNLMAYMQAIHTKNENGLSLYDCLSEYLKIEGGEVPADSLPEIAFNSESARQYDVLTEKLQTVLLLIGSIQEHPLSGLEPSDIRQAAIDDIRQTLLGIQTLIATYEEQKRSLSDATPFSCEGEKDMAWLSEITDIIRQTDYLCADLLGVAADHQQMRIIEQHLSLCRERRDALAAVSAVCSKDICSENPETLKSQWDEIQMKWFLPRYFAKKGFLRRMRQYGNITAEDVYPLLQSVRKYQECCEQIGKNGADMTRYFGPVADNSDASIDRMSSILAAMPRLSELLGTYCQRKNMDREEMDDAFARLLEGGWDAFRKEYLPLAQGLLDTYSSINTAVSHLAENTCNRPETDDVIARTAVWLDSYSKIKDWYQWVALKQSLTQQGLAVIAERMEQGEQPRAAFDALLKGMYHRIIIKEIDSNPQLRMFNGMLFEQQIDQYRTDTRRFQEISKEMLYSILAAKVPSAQTATSDGSEISILKRNINNGGRGMSIRSIIDSIPTLLPRLCPCMLMSPLSVAQFIDLSAEKFDLVIFDEASQMPTSEAVGSIARGKALIVVGDSKQMPPTSFFSSSQVDEDEAYMDDMESILDDCNTLTMKEYQLNWHYRSKHESLISFSNMHYYDNKLLTFPSVDDREVKVSLVKIDGTYDKGKTRSNPDEAKAIVAEVMRRLADPELSRYSIGIISFSKVQQNLIEDLLYEQLDKDAALKDVALNAAEPLFVKNLENVQGDERDIILFSVGYGPDRNGKVSMNFGPLNSAGGERRLNVAVTRARYEMQVFSTLASSQIDLRRSNAKGVAGLKHFLEYAENGQLHDMQQTAADSTCGTLACQIADALRAEGYIASTAIGRSRFKIDVAVSTKENPDRYVLCIMCDGKTYYETKTTRDREIVQPSVLRMLKWNTMRVYSIDWYENRERVMQQILEEIKKGESNEERVENRKKKGEMKEEKGEGREQEEIKVFSIDNIQDIPPAEQMERDAAMLPYKEANITCRIPKEKFSLDSAACRDVILRVIKEEQPICYTYLCKRIAKIFGFGHAGSTVQNAVAVIALQCYSVRAADGTHYVWLNQQSAAGYSSYRGKSPRAINEIPEVEIANAVIEVVKEEFSLPKEKIPTLVARKLGFASAAAKIKEVVGAVICLLEQQNRIRIKDDHVSLP